MQVKAKRLGWNEKLTAVQSLDMDPYEHEGDDDLEGELEIIDAPMLKIKDYLVNGQEADPDTIQEIVAA
jgi:hypothetical protein